MRFTPNRHIRVQRICKLLEFQPMKINRIVLVVIVAVGCLAMRYLISTGPLDKLLNGASIGTLLALLAVFVALMFIAQKAIQKKARRGPPPRN